MARDSEQRVLQFDVTDRDAAAAALLADVEAHGCYYGVVCNAGIARDEAFPADAHEVEAALRSAHALLEFKIATALPVVRP